MSKKINKEKLQNITIVGTLVLIFLTVIFILLLPTKKIQKENAIEVIDHNLYLLKDNGTLAKYNTKDKKYLSELSISSNSSINTKNSFENPFNMDTYNDKIVLTSPQSKEIVIVSEEGDILKKESTIKLIDTPNQIDIYKDTLAVSYLSNKNIDIFDLNSKSKLNTITVDSVVDSIEMDETNLYIGAGKNIFIFSKDNTKGEEVKIYTGAKTISLLKAKDGYLYAGNIFAADSNNSLLLKIDVTKNNIADLLELEKEYPIKLVEHNSDLLVLCKGKADNILDGLSIIDMDIFSRKTNISTGDTPNDTSIIASDFIYVTHDTGEVTLIDLREGYNTHSTFYINGVKSILNR